MNEHRRSIEAARYEKAATGALALLDWCIEHFADNRQGRIARQLARNRDLIRERMKTKPRG